MLTSGHIATSYLIAEGAKHFGVNLTNEQVLQIIIVGNILDIDFLIGLLNGRKGELHHQNVTHTPLGALIVLGLLVLIFKTNPVISLIFLLALFTHLFLDDLGHILAILGIYKENPRSQINWLWPITKFSDKDRITSNKETLEYYLVKAWPIASLEILLTIYAIIRFFKPQVSTNIMEIFYIIFGWLLGLLTQPISLWIDRNQKKKYIKLAIFAELKNLAIRLAGTAYRIKIHLGTLDKNSLLWIKHAYDICDQEFNETLSISLEEMSKKSESDFERINTHYKAANNVSLSVKTIKLTIIDSLIQDISIFDFEFQRQILEISTQINILNQQIQDAREYFYLTFNPDSMKINNEILNKNMTDTYDQISNKCKLIIDLIFKLL